MKGILLACIISPGIFVAMTVVFRSWPELPRVLVSLLIYAISLAALLILYFITPADLGILPDALIESATWLDVLVALFALSASFFGGWLQLYNLTSRGYSLRVLIDLLDTPRQSMTPEDLIAGYAAGRGLSWMYDIRIDGLLQAALVTDEDGYMTLTRRGRNAAHVFSFLRKLYLVGEPQE